MNAPALPAAETAPGSPTIAVLRVGSLTAARLRAAPSDAGRVHSVFERALNLTWHDGRLLTLQGSGPLVAPFAAALERWPRAWPSVDATPRRHGESIELGFARLDWRGAAVADTAMPESGGRPPAALLALMERPLGRSGAGLDGAAGRHGRSRLAEGLERRDADVFLEGALGLVGLGEGLTPAGDDCLVGALATIHRFARPWLSAHAEIPAALGGAAASATTMIAAEFIAHALAGHFAESLTDLLTAGAPESAAAAAARLLSTGATSGADTLVGIRLALAAL